MTNGEMGVMSERVIETGLGGYGGRDGRGEDPKKKKVHTEDS